MKASTKILSIIEMGEGIEKKGRAFYLKHAKTVANAAVAQLIGFLAKQELEHLHYLQKLEKEEKSLQKPLRSSRGSATKDGVKYKIVVKRYRTVKKPRIFSGKMRRNAGDVEVISTAMNFERKSIDLYKKGVAASKNLNEKLFFQRLVEFEEEHYAWLKDMLDNVTYAKIES